MKTHGQAHVQTSTSVTVQGATKGVKSSSETSHNTNATASSNSTKLYGNGKTAGQIAQQNGAGATANIYGPGNSQPHKVVGCNGRHSIDVHALKAHASGAACATKTKTTGNTKNNGETSVTTTTSEESQVTICHATGSSKHPFVVISPSASGVFHGHVGHQDTEDVVPLFTFNGQTVSKNVSSSAAVSSACAAATTGTSITPTSTPPTTPSSPTAQVTTQTPATTPPATPSTPSTSQTAPLAPPSNTTGVQGATAGTPGASTPGTAPAGTAGVNSSTHTAKPLTGTVTSSKLPFTGMPLWIALVAGLGLILTGGAMRVAGRSTH